MVAAILVFAVAMSGLIQIGERVMDDPYTHNEGETNEVITAVPLRQDQ